MQVDRVRDRSATGLEGEPNTFDWTAISTEAAGTRHACFFGPKDNSFGDCGSDTESSHEHQMFLKQDAETSAWLPSFPPPGEPSQVSHAAQSTMDSTPAIADKATQTSTPHSFSVACQTEATLWQDTWTQTLSEIGSEIGALQEGSSPTSANLQKGLESLGSFLLHEQELAQAKAKKRLLLIRLLRQLNLPLASNKLCEQYSTASQTDPCLFQGDHMPSGQSPSSTRPETTKESSSYDGPQEWTPFMDASRQVQEENDSSSGSFSSSCMLARAQSFPSPTDPDAEMMRQQLQLQPAASAPHPIDDIILDSGDHEVMAEVVPDLLNDALEAAKEANIQEDEEEKNLNAPPADADEDSPQKNSDEDYVIL